MVGRRGLSIRGPCGPVRETGTLHIAHTIQSLTHARLIFLCSDHHRRLYTYDSRILYIQHSAPVHLSTGILSSKKRTRHTTHTYPSHPFHPYIHHTPVSSTHPDLLYLGPLLLLLRVKLHCSSAVSQAIERNKALVDPPFRLSCLPNSAVFRLATRSLISIDIPGPVKPAPLVDTSSSGPPRDFLFTTYLPCQAHTLTDTQSEKKFTAGP